jgi:hypothetical protein
MYNWNRIFSHGELKYILKEFKDVENSQELLTASDVLMNNYLSYFGLHKSFTKYNKLCKRLLKMQLEYIGSDKRYLVNQIEIVRKEVDELKKLIFSQNAQDFDKNHVILQKWYGQRIDLRSITVKEYKMIEQTFVEANKKGKK